MFFLCLSSLLFLRDCFWSSFSCITKLRERYRDFTYTSWSHTCIASPGSTSPPLPTFITINELTLTHHNHPKSVVYSWCCTFYGFARMHNGVCPLYCHTECSHCPKIPLCSTFHSPSWVLSISGSTYICHEFLNVRALNVYIYIYWINKGDSKRS